MSTLRKTALFILLLPFIFAAAPVTILGPHIVSLRYFNPVRTSYMWQRPGRVTQTWIGLDQMPSALKKAVVEAEDANFYRHRGVDFGEMKASWEKNRKKKRYARGFSTITMQLVRNLYLTPHKNLIRKAFEVAIAVEVEAVLSKDRILELYLNLIEWSDGVYGAEEAARHYFKKPAFALSASEAAFLASIIPNPRKWGHWPPGPYVAKRQAAILKRIGIRSPAAPARKKKETPPETLPESIPSEPIPDLPENGGDQGAGEGLEGAGVRYFFSQAT